MVQNITPEEVLLRQTSAVSVLTAFDDAKLYEKASESKKVDSSNVKSDEVDERLQDNATDSGDVREDNLEGDGDADGDVDGKADDDNGGNQGGQYADYDNYDDDTTEVVPLQKVVSVYAMENRVPTNPNLGSASVSAPEKEVEVHSPTDKGEDGNELDSTPKEDAEVQGATQRDQKEEGIDDDVVEKSKQPNVNETDVDASPDLGTISGNFAPTYPPSFRSLNIESDEESVDESVEVIIDDQGHKNPTDKTGGSCGVLKIVTTTTTTKIQRTIGLQKRRSAAKPDLPKAPQQLERNQSSPNGAVSMSVKPKSVLRSTSAGISRPKAPTPNVPVRKSARSRGVSPALPRGISSETEKSNESKKSEKKVHITATPDAQSGSSSPDDEFGNMVDSPLVLRKARSTHSVVWHYPLKSFLGQSQGPKESDDLVRDHEETKASTIQKKLTSEEGKSSNAITPDSAPTQKPREKESVVNQSEDIIIRKSDSRASSGSSGLSNSTSATGVTDKASNRSIRTFHPFGGVRPFFNSESEKETSALKIPRKSNKKKSTKVYKMTQGLRKDNSSEGSRIATMTTNEEKSAASSTRNSVRKHTSIQTSKERKSRFSLKMW